MTKQEFEEMKKNNILKAIDAFLAGENNFDFMAYVSLAGIPATKSLDRLFSVAKENLSEEKYNELRSRIFPLEPKEDGSDREEKEELKKRVAKVAVEINSSNANLIDIIDAGVDNIHLYIYMVKQLIYKYKMINPGVLVKNSYYVNMVDSYKRNGSDASAAYSDMTRELEETIKEILASRNLPYNNITLHAAYNYYKRCKANKTNKTTR